MKKLTQPVAQPVGAVYAPFPHLLPRGVMVTQEILDLLFKVRILAG